MMFSTFFRARIPIQKLSSQCYENYQLIILAGPTWSYNPSGPILSLLDSEGNVLFKDQRVLPLISCRGYHRLHNILLRLQLKRYGARLEESLIFAHPTSEPWSTLGVFLKSAGYRPEQISLLKSHYSHFGHTTDQLLQAKRYGNLIGKALLKNESIDLKSSSAQKLVPGYHRSINRERYARESPRANDARTTNIQVPLSTEAERRSYLLIKPSYIETLKPT